MEMLASLLGASCAMIGALLGAACYSLYQDWARQYRGTHR